MRHTKKPLSLCLTVLVFALCIGLFAADARAAETVGGTCGDNLTWELDGNDLTISGTGDMYNYYPENPAPWAGHTFKYVYLEEGVTSVGAYAFYNMDDVFYVVCAASLERIGSSAFAWTYTNSIYLGFIDGPVDIASDAFTNRKVTMNILHNWNEWDRTVTYGKVTYWNQRALALDEETKHIYALNEEFKPEDLVVYAAMGHYVPYTPTNVEFGEYDNSTFGRKTVTITVDGFTFTHEYLVTDGTAHLDMVRVDCPAYVVYNESNRPSPTVWLGDERLEKDVDYTVSYTNFLNVTDQAQVTVTGLGDYAGFEKTFTYAIVKKDLSDLYLVAQKTAYIAAPATPTFNICYNSNGNDIPMRDVPHTTIAEQNVNVGEGFVRAVCTGNYYGAPTGTFQIYLGSDYIHLPGHYMGQADGTLSEETMVSEVYLTPGQFTGCVEAEGLNVAYYELYKVEGENATLVTTYESDVNFSASTTFTYDFSSVYNDAKETGGEIYMLSYVWVDESNAVYSGALIMYIISQVPEATTMQLDLIPDDGDFRNEYLTVCSEDGALQKAIWTCSDTDIATIDQGAVTFHKPGTVTVTATCGDLSAQQQLTADAIPMADVTILDWDTETGTAALMYDYILMTAGTDYSTFAETQGGVITVTAYGKGLFEGQILRQFDAASGQPLDHTHSFDHDCDTTCNSCDFTRAITHNYGGWKKDQNSHWHSCSVCGDRADIAVHTLSAADLNLCTVCGPIIQPGDFNNDYSVDNADVVYLLWHTLFPDDYPIEKNGDLDSSGIVDNEDVVLLLWHTLFPDDYPLEK